MSTTETRLGLTPIFQRLAFFHLTQGYGRRKIDHHQFDLVEVKELYPWRENPQNKGEYGAGIQVTFYKKGRKIRFAEFTIRFSGGGGDQAVRRVK